MTLGVYTDLFGKTRYKINLHMHTTLSDGKCSPAEALKRYRSEGYDAIALTDHWFYGDSDEAADFTVLSGAEYNLGGEDCRNGVYHIVAIGTRTAPAVKRTMSAQQVIDAIHRAGGLASLAHPAWSLNTPEKILKLRDVDATEIYNSVSDVHMSRRPDSSLIVDMLASEGMILPLLATDDAHYYDGSDDCVSWIMVSAEDCTRERLLPAIRRGDFYATQGPEVHLWREGDEFVVRSSPVREIVFLSNATWSPRVFTGDGITEARYTPKDFECFMRAVVTDENGRKAWTNIIPIFQSRKGTT